MQILRKDADALNISLHITVEPSDYFSKYQSKLTKLQNNARVKGFRQGKAPTQMIKKMHGEQTMLEIVNEVVFNALYKYLEENKIKYFGEPLLNNEDQKGIVLDLNGTKNYEFTFDLGLRPEIDVQGISANDSYTLYKVEIPKEKIEEEFTMYRRRFGNVAPTEEKIVNNDIVKLEAKELEDDQVKSDGWLSNFSLLIDRNITPEFNKLIESKSKGDTFRYDIYKISSHTEDHVRKYFLNITDNGSLSIGNNFEFLVTEVSRVELAELNEDFYAKFGSEEIVDETSAKAFLEKGMQEYYTSQTHDFMYREIMDALLEKNQFELPIEFLKKYIKHSNKDTSEENLMQEFEKFEKSLHWIVLKDVMVEQFNITVDNEEVKQLLGRDAMQYMRNYGLNDFDSYNYIVNKLMEDKEQIKKAQDNIQADKLFQSIANQITKVEVPIALDQFHEKVTAMNERFNNL